MLIRHISIKRAICLNYFQFISKSAQHCYLTPASVQTPLSTYTVSGLQAQSQLIPSFAAKKSLYIHQHRNSSLSMSVAPNPTFNVIFVLGGPGAGKGTQCANIVREFGYVHLSAGELLRAEMNSKGGEFYDQINQHMKAGTIVPAQITCGLLERAMVEAYKNEGKLNFLVDGFPRNKDNLDGWTAQLGSKVKIQAVFYMVCSDDICVQRCLGRNSGRPDDNEDTLKKRVEQFHASCKPIIDHYTEQNLVREIDGSEAPDTVFAYVKSIFDQLKATGDN